LKKFLKTFGRVLQMANKLLALKTVMVGLKVWVKRMVLPIAYPIFRLIFLFSLASTASYFAGLQVINTAFFKMLMGAPMLSCKVPTALISNGCYTQAALSVVMGLIIFLIGLLVVAGIIKALNALHEIGSKQGDQK
jgi:hypothetical protein